MKTIIENILNSLNISRRYLGYRLTVYAVTLVLENENRLLHIVKEVYAPTAKMANCSIYCVERNIRTVIFIAWNNNREFLNEIAGAKLSVPPTVSEFIDILSQYIKENCSVSNNT